MKNQQHIICLLASVSFVIMPNASFAGVGKISFPAITKGEAEIEYTGTRYGDSAKAQRNKQKHIYEMEYSFTDSFMFGLEAKSMRQSTKGHEISAYGIEAQYELTNQGDWWIDSAIKGEYLLADHANEPAILEMKILAAYKLGDTRLTGNLNFEKEVGNNRSSGSALESQFQASRHLNEHINPGIEWHAEYGKLDNISSTSAQEHYVGPIISGDLFELGGHEVEYTLGYFFGITNASADNAARLQLGYEFTF